MERNLPFTYRKPAVRWLEYTRRSWKRLGHLKFICSISSPSYGMNLEGITARFQSRITASKVITQEHRQQISEYINSHRSNQYKMRAEDLDPCELQQYYLSDPRLPSQSGALTGKSRAVDYLHTEYVEIPAWAVRLGLLRKGNYTLTERGKVLLAIQPSGNDIFDSEKPDENPYLLTPSEKYFFFYCLLDVDGDLIKKLYKRLILHIGPFSNSKASGYVINDYMIKSLVELKDEIKRRRLNITYGSIATQINNTIEAIRNKSDQAVVPRLEPLVDCGLIRRSSQQNIEYETTSNTRLFIENLNRSSSVDEFLNESLAVNTADLLGLKYTKNLELVPRYMTRSYTRLKSGIGYCSIRDLALLAVAYSIGDGSGTFEVGDVQRTILDFARKYGTSVRFTKDRQGNVALVKFDSSLIRELTGASEVQ